MRQPNQRKNENPDGMGAEDELFGGVQIRLRLRLSVGQVLFRRVRDELPIDRRSGRGSKHGKDESKKDGPTKKRKRRDKHLLGEKKGGEKRRGQSLDRPIKKRKSRRMSAILWTTDRLNATEKRRTTNVWRTKTGRMPHFGAFSPTEGQKKEAEKGQLKDLLAMNGECPQLPLSYRTRFCQKNQKGENGHDECKSDDHCPFAQKCCVGPCDRRQCFYPSLEGNSECFAQVIAVRILAAINAGNKRIYEPKCDAKGQFEKEQKDGEFTFCVDEKGNELAGSRRHSDRFVGCDQKKRCPSVQCQLKCPFGFQFDSVGCALCQCRVSPCDGIACPEGMICRLVPHFCSSVGHSNSSCNVPECLPNVCLKGEPLEDARNGRLIQCDETDGGECPQGWHCRQIGTGPKGFCCSGMLLQAELLPPSNRCPEVPNLSYKWPRPGQFVGCRQNGECHNGESCCFDGVSTQCLALSEAEYSPEISTKRGVSDEIVMRQTKQLMPQGLSQSVSHLANCPLRLPNVSSADCVSNCASDADCARRSAFLRCCPFGCGMQCQFGDRLTPCVHLLASNLREVDKLAEVPISVGRPTVQCTEEGQFEKVQFDPSNGQFWCVDPLSGIESVGSRVSASPLAPVSPPDCSVRHFCKFNCSTTASNRCPHGLRMDHRGCPLDERCQCRNPCEDFKCSLPDSEICLLKSVQCVDDSFCPPIPNCVENVCARFGAQSVGISFCSIASDCQKQLPNSDRIVDCKFISSHLPFDRIGICCAFSSAHLFKEQPTNAEGEISNGQTQFEGEEKQQREKQTEKEKPTEKPKEKPTEKPKEKQGLCPTEANGGGTGESAKGDCPSLCSSDSDCAGIQKCCPNRGDGCPQCVQPILTTNCLNFLSAVLSLDSSHVEHSVPKPNCDPNTGAFSRVQCDNFGFCWCVRSTSSASPLLGTRHFQPTEGESFCETPKVCLFRQCSATVCPFGVEFDLDGCPLSSECRCRNPCDGIQCPVGQICLLRARDCLEVEQFPPDSVAHFGTFCLPVPICELSPCGNVLKPLLNSALLVPQKCQMNSDNRPISLPQCPAAFQCIRPREYSPSAETTPEGICCPRGENDGNGAVENAIGEQQIDENGGEKAIFCLLPVHQGNAVEKCGENRSELRYFYDSQRDKCEAFLFAGCGGNANNFKLKSECEKKCETMENRRKGKATERIEVGFVVDAKGHFRTMENSLRDYLRKTFDLTEGQIRKVRVDGPTEGQVKFTVAAPDAREKAKRISETLALGHFQFSLSDGHLVRAQSDGWWTKRKTNEEEEDEEATGKAENMETEHIPLFWVLFLSVVIFAFVVLLVPCCAFLYLRARPRDAFGRDSIGHDSFCSPSPRVGAHNRNNWNSTAKQRKDGISTTPTVLMEEAEERVHALRMRTTAFCREVPSQAMREDNFLPIPNAFSSSPSPDASSNASTHFGTRQQQIIAPRIVAEEGGEEEQIRRGENTAMRRTWKWAR
ncbi:hypothetical protein niasHT_023536 [Heterodera trifolii]|uniref:Uncharacterized protein n=1 Tax=Heterodera trifolii TaxID=157864 RepID=A0ABD2K368_9BILA